MVRAALQARMLAKVGDVGVDVVYGARVGGVEENTIRKWVPQDIRHCPWL